MKWTKVALILVIPALTILLLGPSFRTPTAEAKPTSIVSVTKVLCLTLTATLDWDADGDVDDDDSLAAFNNCGALDSDDPSPFDSLVSVLGGDPTHPKPEDLSTIDVEEGQLHEKDGLLYFVAFVTNDEPVAFYADKGIFPRSGHSVIACGPSGPPDFSMFDEDCDDDGIRGNGVVIAKLQAEGASRGPATIRVRQGTIEIEDDYTITGEPWNIELKAYATTKQTGAAECVLFSGTADFLATIGAPQTTALTATVTDSDGVPLTYGLVNWSTDDPEKATLAMPLVPTLFSPLGVLAPNVFCGGEEPGTVTVKAAIAKGVGEEGEPGFLGLNLNARPKDAEIEMTVQGPPVKMSLSAQPPSLVCDGTATATITATLTDAEGKPVVDGNVVHFESRALGVVSPLDAKSAGGAATTTLTALSGAMKGVVVNARLLLPTLDEDTEDVVMVTELEDAVVVECSAPSSVPGPSEPVPAPAIQPPATGSGGYLP